MRYTFGDSHIANERLRLIAEVFNPFSEEFISGNVRNKPDSVIDLGCGPGYSTLMLSRALKTKNITGIDFSDNFIGSAKIRFPEYYFIRRDVTDLPLPLSASVIYFRFLLSHLKNIRMLVEGWMKDLKYNGLLIIDELEEIYTENNVFAEYLEINKNLIKSQGANLFIGKNLDHELNGIPMICNESSLHPVADCKAATLFYPNTVSVWKHENWVISNIPEDRRIRISGSLKDLSAHNSQHSSITWKMKRIILKNKF